MSVSNEKINYEVHDWNSMCDDVVLDAYNCDLTMIVKYGCLQGESMIANGFCSLWSGIRATYGMNQGRMAFQIKILRYLRSSDLLPNENPFGIRVGWSVNESGLCLGDESLSYGFEETGKIWTKNQFEWYGERYSVGDTITCYADFESEHGNVLISFSKNDSNFELAYRINYGEIHSRALFPHIFIKNISFQVNFGQLNTKFPLRSGFCFINDYHEHDRIRGTLGPSSKEGCEVIMMVGLPGAGKSVWAERHSTINIDKKYVVLGTKNILNQMKIDEENGNYEIIDRATQCLKAMFELAIHEKRNFIIDQTNVFENPRRRKISLFEGFYRRAVVVIPDDNEYQRRRYKQQKSIPESFINQMKANFSLPEVADVFDDVEYAELAFRDAHNLVMYYRQQGQLTEEPMQFNSLLVIFALTFGCTLSLDVIFNRDWKLWKEANNKHYSDAEEHVRRAVWEDNLKKVQEHNLQADLGVHTYWLGMNKYADLTIDEFVKVMNGYNVSMKGERSRDRDSFTFNPNVKLPDTVDWRKEGLVTPVKNQGQCGASWVFPPVGSLEGQHAKATGKLVSLSERNIIDCATTAGCCNGGLMESTYNYIIKNHGIDTEAGYPSQLSMCQCHFDPTKIGATMTGFTVIKSRDENALQQAVATVGPIATAIDASHASFQLYRHGVYNEPACSQTQLDHGGLIVGYGTFSGQAYWLVKNSWGASWGDQGYILMARNKNNQCGIATDANYPLV